MTGLDGGTCLDGLDADMLLDGLGGGVFLDGLDADILLVGLDTDAIPLSPTMYLLKRILPNLTCGRIIPCLYRLLFLPLSPCFFPPGSSASI